MVIGYFGNAINKGPTGKILEIFNEAFKSRKILLVVQGNHRKSDFENAFFKIRLFNQAPYKEVLSNMRQVDICFNPHGDKDNIKWAIHAKFYDYVASGKPIWNVVKMYSGINYDMSKQYKAVFHSDTNLSSLNRVIDKLLILKERGELDNYGFDEKKAFTFSREYQNRKMKNILI